MKIAFILLAFPVLLIISSIVFDFNTTAGIASVFGLPVAILTLLKVHRLKDFGFAVANRMKSHYDGRRISRALFICDNFYAYARNYEWKLAFKFGGELTAIISEIS